VARVPGRSARVEPARLELVERLAAARAEASEARVSAAAALRERAPARVAGAQVRLVETPGAAPEPAEPVQADAEERPTADVEERGMLAAALRAAATAAPAAVRA
jgi:hypothetical protein